MNSLSISVIIPCYNGARFLRATLASVLSQTYPACEIIVVDDGSTDDSAAIAESFGPAVRLIRQPNQGESVARNHGIDAAQGDWVAFLDADDLWLPDKLADQVRHICLGVGAVCSAMNARYPDGRERLFAPRPEFFDRARILEHGAPCHISAVMVRRDLPVRFPTWTSYAEDLLYYLDLLRHTPVLIAQRPLVVQRIHAASQTARPDARTRQDASLARWLVDNLADLPAAEQAALRGALARRMQHSLLCQALRYRQERRPASALAVYARVLWRSTYSASSSQIVRLGVRGLAGGVAEALRVRRHPAGVA